MNLSSLPSKACSHISVFNLAPRRSSKMFMRATIINNVGNGSRSRRPRLWHPQSGGCQTQTARTSAPASRAPRPRVASAGSDTRVQSGFEHHGTPMLKKLQIQSTQLYNNRATYIGSGFHSVRENFFVAISIFTTQCMSSISTVPCRTV